MKKQLLFVIIFTILSNIFIFSFVQTSFGSTLLLKENFDDQSFDSGKFVIYGTDWTVLSPPAYNLNAAGRGGSGYAFTSGTTRDAHIVWMKNLPSTWPSDEMYFSFWMRYPDFISEETFENFKIFYPHWNGTESYVHYTLKNSGSVYYSAKGNGSMISLSNYISCPNMTDGNWHHYEFYVKFSTAISKFWYDGDLVLSHDYADGVWTPNKVYYISAPSIDAEVKSASLSREVDDWEVWDGMPGTSATPPPPQDAPPTVSIQTPTSQATYFVSQPLINLEGIANDDNTIQSVTWSDNSGNSGTALSTSGNFDTWTTNLTLLEGLNEVTITATDGIGQKSVDKISVTYEIPGTSGFTTAWTAETQAGSSIWMDSGALWCVRLLIKGDSLYHSGSGVRLGFQGRISGDYTIKKVSLAERDPAGGEGDIIDSTWTEITFDGNLVSSWSSDVTTVYQGNVKLSDPISFALQTKKDYYVTFLLTAPSTYMIAPPGDRELYFDGADHTDDLDWSTNGHSVYEQRLHGLSIMQASGFLLPVPSIKKMDMQ